MKQLWLGLIVVVGFVVGASKAAHAEECLEVGWRDQSGSWTYYHAWLDSADSSSGRVHIRYEYHHGELELKVFEKEKADGRDVIVMRGRWFEGRDGHRSGRVRLEMERGHHRARGWYTQGDDDHGEHFDFQLRECRGH